MTFYRNIRQNDEFVSNQTIDVEGPKGTLKNVRILGPVRERAQVEVSLTSARKLGVDAEVRLSENVEETPGAKLIGPEGETYMEQGVIVAARHLHISPERRPPWVLRKARQYVRKCPPQKSDF